MINFFRNFKGFMAWIGQKISKFAWWIVAVILGIAVIFSGIAIAKKINNDKSKNDTSSVEVAQTFEPSISTPLPADVNSSSTNTETVQNSNQIVTDFSSTTTYTAPQNTEIANTSEATAVNNYKAPTSGINPSQPLQYKNSDLQFRASLPANTWADEQPGLVSFSKSGNILFSVSVTKNYLGEISDIYEQLKASPDIKNLSSTTFENKSAIKFYTGNSTGIAVIANNNLYYIIGTPSYYKNMAF